MDMSFDPVGDTHQDQPGKQKAGQFERPKNITLEYISGDNVGKGKQGHQPQADCDGGFLDLIEDVVHFFTRDGRHD